MSGISFAPHGFGSWGSTRSALPFIRFGSGVRKQGIRGSASRDGSVLSKLATLFFFYASGIGDLAGGWGRPASRGLEAAGAPQRRARGAPRLCCCAAAARARRGRGVGAVEERQGAEVRGCRVPLLSRPFWRELQQVTGFSARARVRRSAAGVLLELCRYEHACGVWKPSLHVSSDTAIVQNIY